MVHQFGFRAAPGFHVAGTLLEFAIGAAGDGEELAVDLMRFGPDAPRGAMDFLFIELMLWARVQGYRWLNLGMAPLSGLPFPMVALGWG